MPMVNCFYSTPFARYITKPRGPTGTMVVDNKGWAIGATYLVTGILTSSVASNVQSLGIYFTNWSLLVQLAAFLTFIKHPTRHIWLYDLATVLVWTVAISFSLVTIVSDKLRDDMYELYGVFGFWMGNIIIHYLPVLFNFAVRRMSLAALCSLQI